MKRCLTAVLLLSLFAAGPFVLVANAKPDFAAKEKKACNYCHLSDYGGKGWGFRGLYYKHNGLSFKKFTEKNEAKLAGVNEGSMGQAAKPTKPYPPKKKK
ncbi:MAG: hypothetical protein K1X67_21675 [Fimbriimonadaceae bacterium]|nr:hypothetical protein [Fimbriimonadaceae bacterium]